LSSKDSIDRLLEHLREVPYQSVTYNKFGKEFKTPRKTFCYGTPIDGETVEVKYRGKTYLAEPMPDWLDELRSRIEEFTGYDYNATILNVYESSDDHINWHRDDERFLEHTNVASISIGSLREFQVRTGNTIHSIVLPSGSLLVLHGGIEHRLVKSTIPCGVRYNITFRRLQTNNTKGFGNYAMYNRGEAYRLHK
jgi:alkylated DNA repair dioxygenase AlkB